MRSWLAGLAFQICAHAIYIGEKKRADIGGMGIVLDKRDVWFIAAMGPVQPEIVVNNHAGDPLIAQKSTPVARPVLGVHVGHSDAFEVVNQRFVLPVRALSGGYLGKSEDSAEQKCYKDEREDTAARNGLRPLVHIDDRLIALAPYQIGAKMAGMIISRPIR